MTASGPPPWVSDQDPSSSARDGLDLLRKADLIFEQALALDEGQREAAVEVMCAEGPELLAMVRRLLQADAGADETLDSSAGDPAGRRVGSYRLGELIGQGGMGQVFSAVRADDVHTRQVALKLIRPGLATNVIEGRFRSERHILAHLDHPGIARLLDGGETEGGQPYLVMEYAPGQRIDRHCDQLRLGVRARIEIFLRVCRAIQHAHQRLVIHRDLKPGNILVDPTGSPKLLDFGVAKLLDPRQTPLTQPATEQIGGAPLTPAYASPEQLRGQEMGTTSDVYSLGVVLYELLSGRVPYDSAGRDREAVLQAIGRGDLQPVSEAATNEAAANLGLDRRGLRRTLRGDLDNILAKALSPEVADRYGSVDRLADDLERYLDGRPVMARSHGLGYRLGKLVLRHRLASALSGLLLFVLALSGTVAVLQARRIAHERNRAQQAQAAAESESRRAAQVAAFLTDLFEAASPERAGGRTLTARELLDRGAQRARDKLEGDDRLRASLLDTIGSVYTRMGLPREAQPLLEEALAARSRLFGDNTLERARSLYHLAWLADEQVRPEQGVVWAEQAVAAFEAGSAPAEELAQALALHGGLLSQLGRTEQARAPLDRATALAQVLGKSNPELMAQIACNQGLWHNMRQEWAAALGASERCAALLEALSGEPRPDLATELGNQGAYLKQLGRLREAGRALQRSREMAELLLIPSHSLFSALDMNQAALAMDLGELARAEALFRRVLDERRRAGTDDARYAMALYSVGACLARQGRYRQALPLLVRSSDLLDDTLGKDHPYVAVALQTRARSLSGLGRPRLARSLLERALDILRAAPGDDQWEEADVLRRLGGIELELGSPEAADRRLREALLALDRPGQTDPRAAARVETEALSYYELGLLQHQRGDTKAATTSFHRAQVLAESLIAASEKIDYRRTLALPLLALGRDEAALPLVQQLRTAGWHDPQLDAALARR